MPPTPRTMIINPTKNTAHRTRHRLPRSMTNHHRHVSISEAQPNVQHLPGSNKAKDPLIEFTIVHGLILSARIRKGTYLTHTEAGSPNDYFSVVGHQFYSAAINTQSSDLTEVVSKVLDARSYRQYPGPKACGGYHADLAVRVDHKNGRSWFLFCFGCHEIILVNESGDSYIADMNKPFYDFMNSFFKGLPKPTTYQD